MLFPDALGVPGKVCKSCFDVQPEKKEVPTKKRIKAPKFTPEERICPWCKTPFINTAPKQKFCVRACTIASGREAQAKRVKETMRHD